MKTVADKQVALITGASRGIGRAIAVALATPNRHVIVGFVRDRAAADETGALVAQKGASVELVQVDISDFERTSAAIKQLVAQHGVIEILVNNAGIRKDKLLVRMPESDWRAVIETNLNSFFNVTKLLLKGMLLERRGRIVNISSTAGQAGSAGQVNYSAAKAGLIGATQALAREVATRGITVNAVAPGFIDTEMLAGLPRDEMVKNVPMQRLGKAEEVAAAVAFLCSAEAGYITGQVIGVNGGLC